MKGDLLIGVLRSFAPSLPDRMRHCERSERMDCFVASAPRNDDVAAPRPFRNEIHRVIGPDDFHLIASAAKQSIHPRKERVDCFVALPLAMTMWRERALRDRNVTGRRANHSRAQKPVQPPHQKYFAFSETKISRSVPTVPLLQRGVSRTSRTWGGMRWTQWRRKTGGADADGKVVWSWRPDAGAKFLRSKLLRSDGGKRARSPGRARYKP
jgi:hypothetical protein